MPSLTGDAALDQLVPAATRLACGLREFDPEEVAAAFTDVAALGDTALRGLAVVLAAMVPWDRTPAELLAWVHRREEFERLRALGVDSATAATLLGRSHTAVQHAEGRSDRAP